jgi:hypothetical protein
MSGRKPTFLLAGMPRSLRTGPTQISCHAALDRAACAPFGEERRMELVNATTFPRKFGEWRSIYTLTPDFLSRLGALARFMRLSQRKAAHADVGRAA